jgi:hypothetical protein
MEHIGLFMGAKRNGFESILLVAEEEEEYSTVESSGGSFKMRRILSDEGSPGQELFACSLELALSYEDWVSRIGLGGKSSTKRASMSNKGPRMNTKRGKTSKNASFGLSEIGSDSQGVNSAAGKIRVRWQLL